MGDTWYYIEYYCGLDVGVCSFEVSTVVANPLVLEPMPYTSVALAEHNLNVR